MSCRNSILLGVSFFDPNASGKNLYLPAARKYGDTSTEDLKLVVCFIAAEKIHSNDQ